MRPWQLTIIIVITGVAALASGWHPMYVLFYVLLLSLVVSYAIAAWSGNGLAFARTFPGGRAQKGEILQERLRLENRARLPKLWVQVTDSSTLPGHHAGYVASIGGRQRIDWRVRTTCSRRGRFFLGPVIATTGDPLGLFTRTIPLAAQRELLVLPQVLPITRFRLFPGAMPGRGRGAQRSLQTTTNAVTVRDYLPGDALSRIHWPTSARLSKLMVKEFDLDPTIDVWLVLDMDETAQAGEGDESTEEVGVAIAATLANFFLRDDLAVGLLINDHAHSALALDRGVRQIDHVLEALAVTRASEAPSLRALLTLNEVKFMRNSVVVVITPSTDTDWAVGLKQLERRGVRASVISLDPASFGGEQSNAEVVTYLLSHAIPMMTIRRGDALAPALELGTAR